MEYGPMAVAIAAVMISFASFIVASRANKEVIELRDKIRNLISELGE